MKPKAFVMSEPQFVGVWLFMLTIDRKYWDFVKRMPCVNTTSELSGNNIHVWIDPRYDYEEAWLWIYEQLETETHEVVLGAVWDSE
jgi:hypothetical protein